MKLYKGFLHFLLTLVSTFAFLLGWATLAHSLKPTQPVKQEALAPMAPLDPLPPVGFSNAPSSSSDFQSFSPSRSRSRSMFVTRGS